MKTLFPYLLFWLMMMAMMATGQEIKRIYLECNAGDFENMYENYDEEIFIPVLITYEGTTWQDVRLRLRGDSSKEYPKKSLKAVFDGEPFVQGETELNFNADYKDISYMRSLLSSRVFNEAGIPCAAIEHVLLYLNGSFFGIYLLTQDVDIQFLLMHGFTGNGNLYKAALDGACLSIYDNIYYHWEKKQDDTPFRDDLAELIHNLNFTENDDFFDFVYNTFDYDRLLTLLAMNMLLANGSTYYHNYFLYHETENPGKWFMFPWDLDLTFSAYTKWYPFHSSSGYWTPDNPLHERSLIDDQVFADIKTRISDLAGTVFNPERLFPVTDSLHDLLLPYILLDTTDKVEDIAMWEEYIDANRDFITGRYSHLIYQVNHCPRNFTLDKTEGYHTPEESVQFSWEASVDPNGLPVTYNLYISMDQSFEDSTTLVVTGLTANQYTSGPLENEGRYFWKVEATNNSFNIEGFDTYNPLYISKGIPPLVINEINYKSAPETDAEDWVEFFNPLDTVVSLAGWYFMDDDDAHKFIFPAGAFIEPQGYLVLCRDTSMFFQHYADTMNVSGNMDFGLKSEGEMIRLYHPTGYLVDMLTYRSEFPWPGTPNGLGPTLELINPELDNALALSWDASAGNGTPCRKNSVYIPGSGSDYRPDPLISVSPNPFVHLTHVLFELAGHQTVRVIVYNAAGLKIMEQKRLSGPGKQCISLDMQAFPAGIYYISVDAEHTSAGTIKVLKTGR
ncbi:MAG: CotH kinase family protein [Bacteroidales bacterium]|nr:CotH kinase family protein [Bacteroidales bacterium]